MSPPADPPSVAAPSPRPVPLTDLGEGRQARLHQAELEPEDGAYLAALGLTSRSPVRVAKVGDPWIVQVRSTRIGLSHDVAQRILVVPEAERDAAD